MFKQRPVTLAASALGLLLAGCTIRTETKAPVPKDVLVTVHVEGMKKVLGIT
jgi:hypothetical protein